MWYLTNSELTLFRRCKRSWFIHYVLSIQPKTEKKTGPLVIGTVVHDALEHWYTEKIDPVVYATMEYAKRLEEVQDDPDVIATMTKDADLVTKMLGGYIDWAEQEGIDDDLELIGIEQVIEHPYDKNPDIVLRGKLDQRWVRKSSGLKVFRDFKTVQSFLTPGTVTQLDSQMRYYNLLERMSVGLGIDGALYTQLRKVKRSATAKPPFYAQIEIRHSPKVIENFKAALDYQIAEMTFLKKEGFDACYPSPSKDCSWQCNSQDICTLKDNGGRWKDLIAEHYVSKNPMERYNDRAQ